MLSLVRNVSGGAMQRKDPTAAQRQAAFRARWIDSGRYKRVVSLLPAGTVKDMTRLAKAGGLTQAELITLLVAHAMHRSSGQRWTDIDGKRHDDGSPPPKLPVLTP
jgi:hypothetical protein